MIRIKFLKADERGRVGPLRNGRGLDGRLSPRGLLRETIWFRTMLRHFPPWPGICIGEADHQVARRPPSGPRCGCRKGHYNAGNAAAGTVPRKTATNKPESEPTALKVAVPRPVAPPAALLKVDRVYQAETPALDELIDALHLLLVGSPESPESRPSLRGQAHLLSGPARVRNVSEWRSAYTCGSAPKSNGNGNPSPPSATSPAGTATCISWPVHAIYADDGVSGTVPLDRRPEGAKLLRDARLKKFDQLLVYKLDRLGRETRLTLEAVAELEKSGVRVRSMTEEFDSQTPTGRLMMTMLSGFAAHEREVIRERSMAGTERSAEAGVWLGGIVPYGYRKEGMKGQSRLVISEEQIPGFGDD